MYQVNRREGARMNTGLLGAVLYTPPFFKRSTRTLVVLCFFKYNIIHSINTPVFVKHLRFSNFITYRIIEWSASRFPRTAYYFSRIILFRRAIRISTLLLLLDEFRLFSYVNDNGL